MSRATYRNIEDGAEESYLAKLLRYRHLCFNLVGSDLRSRFRRSSLGILWAMLQPIGFSLVIAYVWSALFNRDFGSFAVHVMSGLIVWDFFGGAITRGLQSLHYGAGYLRQTRLPFFILQVRVPLVSVVTFTLATVGFLGLQFILGETPPLQPSIVLLVPFLGVMLLLAIPLSMIFSVLGALFRDLQHIAALAMQGLLFCSPIIAERERFETPRLLFLQWANPLMPLTDMFRDPTINGRWWDPYDLMVVAGWAIVLWAIALGVSSLFGRRLVYSL